MNVLQFIKREAPTMNLDWRAVAAIAEHESGLRAGAVGDNGSSFGPFQLHVGGALPSGRGAAWAESPAGMMYAMHQMARAGAAGLSGRAAVSAISRRFERPADPGAEIADAMSHYGGFGGGGATPMGGGGGGGGFGPHAATTPSRMGLIQTVMQNNQNFALTGSIDPTFQTSVMQNGLTNFDQMKLGNVKAPTGGMSMMGVGGKVGKAISFAKGMIGVPYVWGGTTSRGVDCSGLVQLAYAKAGINIPRTTYQQYKVGQPVKWGNFQPGDLIFSDFEGTGQPTHVVMYLGHGKVVAAPHTGTNVQIENLSVFRNNFIGARRVAG